ncbi:MAG: hypothetical protein Kow006_32040 [Gammaproteobacteria bacterium]
MNEPKGIDEMSQTTVTSIDEFPAPFNKQIKLEEVVYDNDFKLLRIRIREGKRFTTMELDADTARKWGGLMLEWAEANSPVA